MTEKTEGRIELSTPIMRDDFAPLFPITKVTHSDDASGLLWELRTLYTVRYFHQAPQNRKKISNDLLLYVWLLVLVTSPLLQNYNVKCGKLRYSDGVNIFYKWFICCFLCHVVFMFAYCR